MTLRFSVSNVIWLLCVFYSFHVQVCFIFGLYLHCFGFDLSFTFLLLIFWLGLYFLVSVNTRNVIHLKLKTDKYSKLVWVITKAGSKSAIAMFSTGYDVCGHIKWGNKETNESLFTRLTIKSSGRYSQYVVQQQTWLT